MDEYQGVKIERLPTIGEPYTLKTRKQGRVGSIYDNIKDDLTRYTKDHVNESKQGKTRGVRIDKSVWLNNAKRIIAYPNASKSQKAAAQRLLNLMDKEGVELRAAITLVQGITRTLSRRYRDF